jgi:hypothetical protein
VLLRATEGEMGAEPQDYAPRRGRPHEDLIASSARTFAVRKRSVPSLWGTVVRTNG